ncbi:hypothetical protein EXIGLDRAFT_775228 [Exidia glandulosa HHB12029]|uniref:Uncharacterized protein n=1 Tax=Exidia glandulosa HHB12029 TaxID=1314781 RepID=A0A165ZUU1_EXIGL|nr:hypothetical protein EXIGLDRAFT_775228 [Exidia glandulosa HHB12029]
MPLLSAVKNAFTRGTNLDGYEEESGDQKTEHTKQIVVEHQLNDDAHVPGTAAAAETHHISPADAPFPPQTPATAEAVETRKS